MKFFKELIMVFFILLTLPKCGGASSSNNSDACNSGDPTCDPLVGTSETVNTEKLLNTPFEGLASGDNLSPYLFSCGQYRTDMIVSFPIPIFLAFFTDVEETYIQEGVDMANEAIGFTAYQITDAWLDDARVIYKVDAAENSDASGLMFGLERFFNGLAYAENESPDWTIQLTQGGIGSAVVAHELGHASGIANHNLIDYENNTLLELESDSIMRTDGSVYNSDPSLIDYNYMMSMQGQIMIDHLGEVGDGVNMDASCD